MEFDVQDHAPAAVVPRRKTIVHLSGG